MKLLPIALVGCVLGACATQDKQKATDSGAIRKAGSEEIKRICSLPAPDRDAEIKKMQEQSGVILYCGDQ